MTRAITPGPSVAEPVHRIAVAIVDDEEGVRVSLKMILVASEEFQWVGSYATAGGALAGLPGVRPDVVLMDIRMPEMNGIECVRQLKIKLPRLKCVMVTGLIDSGTVGKALAAGADGYLTKPFSVEGCRAAIKFAMTGGMPMSPNIAPEIKADITRAHPEPVEGSTLSLREQQIMNHLSHGFYYKEIADKVGLSVAGVKKRLHRIFGRLKAQNRTEAIEQWRGERRKGVSKRVIQKSDHSRR